MDEWQYKDNKLKTDILGLVLEEVYTNGKDFERMRWIHGMIIMLFVFFTLGINYIIYI